MGTRLTGTGRPRRLALTAVAVTGLLAGGFAAPALAAAPSAVAAAVPGTVATGGQPLNVRTGPSAATARQGLLPHGSRLTIECQAPGQMIRGSVRTTRWWDRLPDRTFVSDAYVGRAKAALPTCAAVDAAAAAGQPATGGQVMPPATPTGVTVSASGWTHPLPGTVGSGFRTKARPTHDGIDIGAAKYTPIRSAAAGRAITVACNASTKNCDVDGSPKIGGCGWYVEIQHADRVVTRYCHMVAKPAVAVGQQVRTGQVIGYVGSSGNSSGPHLHFEIHTKAAPALRANAVEPVAFLRTKGVTVT